MVKKMSLTLGISFFNFLPASDKGGHRMIAVPLRH